MVERVKTGFLRTKLTLCALCILGYIAIVAACGGTPWGVLWTWLCVAAYLYWPGRFFAHISGLDRELPGFGAPLGILLGTGFFAALYCVCMRLHWLWLLRALPPMLALLWLGIWLRMQMRSLPDLRPGRGLAAGNGTTSDDTVADSAVNGGIAQKTYWQVLASCPRMLWQRLQTDSRLALRLLLWASLVLLYAFAVCAPNMHASVAGAINPSKDLLWNIGNVQSFTGAFPPQDIRFSMVRLSYHYLTELTEGALSIVSGLPAYDLVAFYIGPVVLAALLSCLYAMAQRFFKNDDKAMLFLGSLFFLACGSTVYAWNTGLSLFGITHFHHLLTNINAQGTALIFISIFIVLLQHIAEKKFSVRWKIIGAFLGCFALVSVAKGPAAAIVTCAFGITMLFLLARKPHWGKAMACLLGVVGIFVGLYVTMFSAGANSSMLRVVVPFGETKAYTWLAPLYNAMPLHSYVWLAVIFLVDMICIQPFQFPLFCRGAWRDLKNILHLPAERLLVNAVAVGGILAYYMYWHANSSQMYFMLIAIFCMNLLAIDALPLVRTRVFRGVLKGLACVALLTTLGFAAHMTLEGVRFLAYRADAGVQPKPAASYVLAEDEQAMAWLRDNTDDTAQFATNRIHSTVDRPDGISNSYTALSGRQAFMEGYTYAVSNMGVSQAVLDEKMRVNSALFSKDTPPEEVRALCAQYGITHLVVSAQYPGDTTQLSLCETVFENEAVRIYSVD